ncbi:hypothetical protein C8F01DRAFT_1318212 [Mycena amicta]|nr:hypothetical protein C8F01DRAFT_1318212 [Mycena amicta]
MAWIATHCSFIVHTHLLLNLLHLHLLLRSSILHRILRLPTDYADFARNPMLLARRISFPSALRANGQGRSEQHTARMCIVLDDVRDLFWSWRTTQGEWKTAWAPLQDPQSR